MRRSFRSLWLDFLFPRKTAPKVKNQDLEGKFVFITGATDGMGRLALNRFAEMGADICFIGRREEKAKQIVTDVEALNGGGKISYKICDLSSLTDINDIVRGLKAEGRKIDYLINCAGVNVYERKITEDGFEMNFAVNYLAPYHLTEELLVLMSDQKGTRIIQVTSATQASGFVDFMDLQLRKNWSMFKAYTQAKLAMIMHVMELAERLKDSNVEVMAINPGYIATNLLRDIKGGISFMKQFTNWRASPAWIGGERIVSAALENQFDGNSGAYIYEDEPVEPNKQALDDNVRKRLMTVSQELVAID